MAQIAMLILVVAVLLRAFQLGIEIYTSKLEWEDSDDV